MRALNATEQSALQARHRTSSLRVLAEDAAGVLQDLSALAGRNWIHGVDWGSTVDDATESATITLHRNLYGTSISTLADASPLNADGPLLDVGREIQVQTSTGPSGSARGAPAWRSVFGGTVDDTDLLSGPQVALPLRDRGGLLLDTQIEAAKEYGSAEGVPLHVVMQQLLDDTLGAGVVTLYAPAPPAFLVTPYTQEPKGLLEALQDLAALAGYVVRYRWSDAALDYVLTLYEPDRAKTVPDWTFTRGQYLKPKRLQISRDRVRNVIRVEFTNAATGERDFVQVQDDPSIGKFGRRFMRLVETSGPIDTPEEATAMANAALLDLRDPLAELEVPLLYWWPVELGDLLRFEASPGKFDTAQTLAVVGIRHTWSGGQRRTVVTLRGRPAGAYAAWLRRETKAANQGPEGPKGEPGAAACSLKITVAVAEPNHTVTITAFPADAAVSATLNGSAKALTAMGGGVYTCVLTRSATADQRLIVQAESEGYAAGSSTYSIDRDPTPGLSVSAPVPVFSGSEQSGWQLGGSADDDAKQVEVALTGGLTLAQSTPVVAGGQMDTSSAKSFVLTLAQPLGSKGTVTLTPKDGSTRGEPWSMELSLAPRTTATLTEITSTIRRVTLQTDPVGGRIYVRALRASGGAIATYLPSAAGTLDRGTASTAQRSAPGPSLTIFVDLAGVGEDLLLEYYSVAGSVTEAIRRQRIDEDHDPEVGITATGGSNLLAVTATPDDDLVLWRLWAKRAGGAGTAWPTKDGTEGGAPDDRYRTFEGGQDAREVSWWAKEGTWYLLARAYDYAGKYTPTSLVVTVTAAASTAAALSALAVTRQDNASGTDYHVFTWAHNAPITGTSGHVVKVLEGGAIVASKAASTNTAQVETPEQKTSGEANAVFRRYEYTLQLRDSGGGVISSYPLVVEGYYDNGTVPVTAPAETPGIPALSKLGKVVTADWVNTSTAWGIELDWWRGGVSFYVQTLAPSVEEATNAYSSGDQAQARVRYTNEAGPGPWSLPSNPLVV